MIKQIVSIAAINCCCVCSIFGQARPTAFVNAKIIPITGLPIDQGTLIVHNGKITAVGDARTVKLSADVQTIDLAGKVLMPGLVDTHSHIGSGSGADASGPIQPDVRLLESTPAPRACSGPRQEALRR